MMKRVAFLTSVGYEEGMGHLYRCVALAEEFRDRGWGVCFILPDYAPAAEMVRARRLRFETGDSTNPAYVRQFFTDHSFQVALVDQLRPKSRVLATLKSLNLFVMRLDGERPNDRFSDLIISIQSQSDTAVAPSHTGKLLTGIDYWIFPRDLQTRRAKVKISRNLRRMLISFGNSDPKGHTFRIARELKERRIDDAVDVTIVSGVGYRDERRLNALCGDRTDFRLCEQVRDLPRLLQTHDLFICGGGGSFFEAALLGLPTIIYASGTMNRRLAEIVEKRRLGLHLRRCRDVTKAMAQMNYHRRSAIAKRLTSEITGSGAQRIVRALDEELKKHHEAE